MAFASFDHRRGGAPLAEINMVPLIDVMLVLLVIFILTAPLLAQAVKVQLPTTGAPAAAAPPQHVVVTIDAAGALYWNGDPVRRDEARRRFALAAAQPQQPEVQLRADQAVAYRVVAQTLADAATAGLGRFGFLSEPDPPH